MTSVGRRPTLYELLEALHAIQRIEADADALDPKKEMFRVVLTFQRAQCPDDWREGQPKPSWLFEQILDELHAWLQQRNREEQWVSKEAQFGASIDTLMMYWTEELKANAAVRPESLLTRTKKQTLSNTVVRLQELKERRAAGGVYSATENRRDKARKTWMEDEYEAPKREEEQRKQQGFSDFSYTGFDGIDPEAIKNAWDDLLFNFNFDARQRKDPHRAQAGNKRYWFQVLGVDVRASKKEITQAYRKLAAKYHPDRYKEADGHAKMAEINTARDEGLGGL